MEDTGGKQTYPSAPPAYSEAVNDSSGAYNNDNIAYYPPPTAPPAYNGPQQPTYYAPHQGQPLPQAAANSSLYQNRSTVVVVDQDAARASRQRKCLTSIIGFTVGFTITFTIIYLF